MNITLEMKPEIQAELVRQAAASGLPMESHAATLLEEAVHLPFCTVPHRALQQHGLGKSLVDVCAMVPA